MSRFIIFLGAPGAGKGTQAKVLSKALDLPHISSGNIFRQNLKVKTALGQEAAVFINQGKLVPDSITNAMIKDRLLRDDCVKGALLDGFPRNMPQVVALNAILDEFNGSIEVVPYINVELDVLIKRLTGRLTCRAKGHVFHQDFDPPQVQGICDIDGSELYQRNDDSYETVKHRIEVYLDETQPLIDYFSEQGLLLEIDGSNPIEQVSKDLLSAIDKVIS
jgi:adenylate kinase